MHTNEKYPTHEGIQSANINAVTDKLLKGHSNLKQRANREERKDRDLHAIRIRTMYDALFHPHLSSLSISPIILSLPTFFFTSLSPLFLYPTLSSIILLTNLPIPLLSPFSPLLLASSLACGWFLPTAAVILPYLESHCLFLFALKPIRLR